MAVIKDEADNASNGGGSASRRGTTLIKLAVAAAFLICIAIIYVVYRDKLSLQYLAQFEASFRDFQEKHFLIVYAAAFVIYVAVTGLSLPGATGMTLLCAWLFGFWRALVLVSFASTTGATLAFLLSRFVLREWVQRSFGERLKGFNEALEREGAFYLFTLRLIPAVPFFVINVVMGLTRMRVWTYWWVSQIGMLAGTCVYVYAGSNIPTLQQIADPAKLRASDIVDWPGFSESLASGESDTAAEPARRIWQRLSSEDRAAIQNEKRRPLSETDKQRIIAAINEQMVRRDFLLPESWQSVEMKPHEITSLNRRLLEIAFRDKIGSPRPILNWQLLAALVLLGVFPLAVKKAMTWIRREPHAT